MAPDEPLPPHPPPPEPAPPSAALHIGGDYVGGDKITNKTAGGDIVEGDKTTTIYTEETAYDVSGLPNPYLGLRSFTYAERSSYGGRQLSVAEGLAKLTTPGEQRPLLFVTGASGSGKSSFAQAGLLPALEDHYRQRGQTVRSAIFRPGAHPLAALADALQQLSAGDSPAPGVPLLIIDQFEELFTQSAPDEREQFFRWLTGRPAFSAEPQHILATLRSDYLNELFEVTAVWEVAKQGLELRAMTGEELKAAIQRPLQSAYPRGEKRMEPALVERLAADAAGAATYLPLLQVTLEELWKKGRLGLSNYGTLTDAIRQRANQVIAFSDYDSAAPHQPRPAAEQDVILDLFLNLVNVSSDEDPRRDVRISRATADLTPAQRRLTGDLSRARLLSVADEANVETVNIIHETLINNWDRLREGVKARRQKLRQRVRFEQQLQLWLANAKSDDYLLLTSVQLAEARELDLAADVALRGPNAQELLRRSAAYEAAERQHELEQAQALADAERRRAESERQGAARLRQRAVYLGVALASTVLLALVTVFYWAQANLSNAGLQIAASTAEAASTLAVNEATNSARSASAAETAQADAERQASVALSRQLAAQASLQRDQAYDLSLLLSVESYRVSHTDEARNSLLTGLTHSPHLTTVRRVHNQFVSSVAYSPAGPLMASGSWGDSIRLWDMSDPEAPLPIGAPLAGQGGDVTSLAFSADGQLLAAGSSTQTISLWDVSNPKAPVAVDAPLTGPTYDVTSLVFSPVGRLLAAISPDKTIPLWDLSTPSAPVQIASLRYADFDLATSLAFSPDGRLLAVGSAGASIVLWDLSDPETPVQLGLPLTNQAGGVSSLVFSPDGLILISAGYDGYLIEWDVTDPEFPFTFGQTFAAVSNPGATTFNIALAFSRDGQLLASASRDTIMLWDMSSLYTPVQIGSPLTGHTEDVSSLAFSPDSRTLVSGSYDDSLMVWDVSSPQPNVQLGLPLTAHTTSVSRVAFSPNGRLMAAGGYDQSITLWDVSNPAAPGLLYRLPADEIEDVYALAFSPDSQLLAASGASSSVLLWDISTPQAPALLEDLDSGAALAYMNLVFSPDGVWLASGAYLAFLANSRLLVGGATVRTISLWDVSTPAAAIQLDLPADDQLYQTPGMVFSPNGQLSAEMLPNKFTLWDLSDPAAPAQLGSTVTPNELVLTAVAIGPDGQFVVSANKDLLLWDLSNPRLPLQLGPPLEAHTDTVLTVAFSPDGTVMASGGADRTIILWDLNPASWQAKACRMAYRNLTQEEWVRYLGDEPYQKTCSDLPAGE